MPAWGPEVNNIALHSRKVAADLQNLLPRKKFW